MKPFVQLRLLLPLLLLLAGCNSPPNEEAHVNLEDFRNCKDRLPSGTPVDCDADVTQRELAGSPGPGWICISEHRQNDIVGQMWTDGTAWRFRGEDLLRRPVTSAILTVHGEAETETHVIQLGRSGFVDLGVQNLWDGNGVTWDLSASSFAVLGKPTWISSNALSIHVTKAEDIWWHVAVVEGEQRLYLPVMKRFDDWWGVPNEIRFQGENFNLTFKHEPLVDIAGLDTSGLNAIMQENDCVDESVMLQPSAGSSRASWG